MSDRFLFLPYWAWVLLCLGVGLLYLRVTPAGANGPGWPGLALRWAHPAAWFLLALAASLRGLLGPGAGSVKVLGLLAGACYGAFLLAVISRKEYRFEEDN